MCNFSGMIKNVLPSLRQRAGPQRICSRQKSIRSGTARNSFSQTPHMRGKGHHPDSSAVWSGITPAHAGKSGWLDLEPPTFAGSPPRMRGKGVVYVFVPEKLRITPAHAGKRFTASVTTSQSRDHPRVCGEKFTRMSVVASMRGSPPRMRGKDVEMIGEIVDIRITPAYAGKSPARPVTGHWRWDHLRVCGEKRFRNVWSSRIVGSPPHVRGKGDAAHRCRPWLGITPAHAGKRLYYSCALATLEDHPRMCGEKQISVIFSRDKYGSPPRMRGKAFPDTVPIVGVGITPAYAGKSGEQSFREISTWDHPRVCGEKVIQVVPPAPQVGSPPRMRGKGREVDADLLHPGITPAYAGKSCSPNLGRCLQ